MKLSELKKNRSFMAVAVAMAVGLFAWIIEGNLIITLSPSLEHRVFVKKGRASKLKKGDYVMFRLKHDRYAKPGDRILKKVACIGGDTLKVTRDKKYYCNGVYLGRAKDRTLKGEKLDNFVYNGTIPKDRFFVMGRHKDSYDSRYFGFLSMEQVEVSAYSAFKEGRYLR